MKKLYISIIGKGKIHLILFHGWGISSYIWNNVIIKLKKICTIYVIDLPGYGKNFNKKIMTFEEISNYILTIIPKKAVWMGWSIGGLLAFHIGHNFPNYTNAIITICSSPCFIQKKLWPGISLKTLKNIKNEIINNFSNFYKNFNIYQRQSKKKFLKEQKPRKESIEQGYIWLTTIDQRKNITNINTPYLKIYGSLDLLIPEKISYIIDKYSKKTLSIKISKATHAPFLSHPNNFIKIITNFFKNNNFIN